LKDSNSLNSCDSGFKNPPEHCFRTTTRPPESVDQLGSSIGPSSDASITLTRSSSVDRLSSNASWDLQGKMDSIPVWRKHAPIRSTPLRNKIDATPHSPSSVNFASQAPPRYAYDPISPARQAAQLERDTILQGYRSQPGLTKNDWEVIGLEECNWTSLTSAETSWSAFTATSSTNGDESTHYAPFISTITSLSNPEELSIPEMIKLASRRDGQFVPSTRLDSSNLEPHFKAESSASESTQPSEFGSAVGGDDYSTTNAQVVVCWSEEGYEEVGYDRGARGAGIAELVGDELGPVLAKEGRCSFALGRFIGEDLEVQARRTRHAVVYPNASPPSPTSQTTVVHPNASPLRPTSQTQSEVLQRLPGPISIDIDDRPRDVARSSDEGESTAHHPPLVLVFPPPSIDSDLAIDPDPGDTPQSIIKGPVITQDNFKSWFTDGASGHDKSGTLLVKSTGVGFDIAANGLDGRGYRSCGLSSGSSPNSTNQLARFIHSSATTSSRRFDVPVTPTPIKPIQASSLTNPQDAAGSTTDPMDLSAALEASAAAESTPAVVSMRAHPPETKCDPVSPPTCDVDHGQTSHQVLGLSLSLTSRPLSPVGDLDNVDFYNTATGLEGGGCCTIASICHDGTPARDCIDLADLTTPYNRPHRHSSATCPSSQLPNVVGPHSDGHCAQIVQASNPLPSVRSKPLRPDPASGKRGLTNTDWAILGLRENDWESLFAGRVELPASWTAEERRGDVGGEVVSSEASSEWKWRPPHPLHLRPLRPQPHASLTPFGLVDVATPHSTSQRQPAPSTVVGFPSKLSSSCNSLNQAHLSQAPVKHLEALLSTNSSNANTSLSSLAELRSVLETSSMAKATPAVDVYGLGSIDITVREDNHWQMHQTERLDIHLPLEGEGCQCRSGGDSPGPPISPHHQGISFSPSQHGCATSNLQIYFFPLEALGAIKLDELEPWLGSPLGSGFKLSGRHSKEHLSMELLEEVSRRGTLSMHEPHQARSGDGTLLTAMASSPTEVFAHRLPARLSYPRVVYQVSWLSWAPSAAASPSNLALR
jgi:hypothetical protein